MWQAAFHSSPIGHDEVEAHAEIKHLSLKLYHFVTDKEPLQKWEQYLFF